MATDENGTLPSVTQVISPWSWETLRRVRPDVLAAAQDRGRRVHSACAAIAAGVWLPPVAEDIKGYVASFRLWFEAVVDEVALLEERLTCNVYRFTGRPDLVCRLKGDKTLTVVDYKTPRPLVRAWRLQLAAYRHLAGNRLGGVQRVMSLRLNPGGAPPIASEHEPHVVSHDMSVFLNALAVFNFFKGR